MKIYFVLISMFFSGFAFSQGPCPPKPESIRHCEGLEGLAKVTCIKDEENRAYEARKRCDEYRKQERIRRESKGKVVPK